MARTPGSKNKESKNEESKNEKTPKNTKVVSASNAQDDSYMIEKSKIIGKNIRSERKLRNFSVENLAEFLELSISYIGLLERGDRCPSLKIVYKICELFGTTPNDLLVEKQYDEKLNRILVAEDKPVNNKYKSEAVSSLIATLSDQELDFTLTTIKNLKRISR